MTGLLCIIQYAIFQQYDVKPMKNQVGPDNPRTDIVRTIHAVGVWWHAINQVTKSNQPIH